MGDSVVRTDKLCRLYSSGPTIVKAVSNVTFSVERGEFVAIVGRSGSGKSTLMSLLGLLERPDSGEYLLNGQKTSDLSEDARADLRSRHIGFVFQLPSLLARASALENAELPFGYCNVPGVEARRRAEEALARVGLSHRIDHWPHQLSGGEQQRVAIARSIVNNPALILADEPTGALDSKTSSEILSLFKELNSEGRTIIVVTHAHDVAQCAKRCVTLHDGQISNDETQLGAPILQSEAIP